MLGRLARRFERRLRRRNPFLGRHRRGPSRPPPSDEIAGHPRPGPVEALPDRRAVAPGGPSARSAHRPRDGALPPARAIAAGVGGVLGAPRRLARRGARRGAGRGRQERRRQEHAAQDHLAGHGADGRARRAVRPCRQPARGRHRVSSGPDGSREHLSERHHPRHAEAARSIASSTRSSPSRKSSPSSTRPSSAIRAACTCGSPSPSPRTSTPRSS